MIKEYKAFTDETLQDALSVINERFPPSAAEIARKILRNPLRKRDPDAGTIGYRDGRPVCFQAHMIRRLYLGQNEVYGVVGGLTCKVKKGCPLTVLLETIDRAGALRADERMGFGNSCCDATADMDAESGSHPGPDSCAHSLWRPVRWLACLNYIVCRKVLKRPIPDWPVHDYREGQSFAHTSGDIVVRRELTIDSSFFADMMAKHLAENHGLFASRTAEEVEWMYGDKLRNGAAVLLCARKGGSPGGYIIMGSDHAARRWMMLDWFAAGNDKRCLEALLKSACSFLRRHTPAFMLETRGFPSFIQPLLKKYLPFVQQQGVNFFSWGVSPLMDTRCVSLADSSESWFFGPYDGDLCM